MSRRDWASRFTQYGLAAGYAACFLASCFFQLLVFLFLTACLSLAHGQHSWQLVITSYAISMPSCKLLIINKLYRVAVGMIPLFRKSSKMTTK